MGFRDSWWTMSMSSLVILSALVFEILCGKTDINGECACVGQAHSPAVDTLQLTNTRPPSKVPLPLRDMQPHIIHGSLDPHESVPTKRHLGQPSHSAQIICVPNTQTDRHTDHTTCNICSNKLHLCTTGK